MKICTTWADANARQWDEHVQGIAIVLANPLVRSFAAMVTKMMQPPQPISWCATEAEALAFLGSIRVARSYVKQQGYLCVK